MTLAKRAAATAQVLIEDLDALQLSADDKHHLQNVLRVRNGESISVTNGRGDWRMCEWQSGALVSATAVETDVRTPSGSVAFALTKGAKPEWTIQKLTELGVSEIVPFVAERSIVKWDAGKQRDNVERFRRIAEAAAMQSRQVWLPLISEISDFERVIQHGYWLAAPGGNAWTPSVDKVAVGPEGGWSPAELSKADKTVDLGPTILRAETAALAAAVRLQSF